MSCELRDARSVGESCLMDESCLPVASQSPSLQQLSMTSVPATSPDSLSSKEIQPEEVQSTAFVEGHSHSEVSAADEVTDAVTAASKV